MSDLKKRNQYDFDKRKYDHIHLQSAKGQRDIIRAHAQERGESLNGFINRAISETIQRDNS